MNSLSIGQSGIRVSPVCLRASVFGWTVDQLQSHRLLDAWVDAGMNFIDTADSYSRWVPGNVGGESESIIGNWLSAGGRRSKLVIATKIGSEMGPGMKGLSRAYICRAVDDCLRRLRTDFIDLLQAHWDDPLTPFEETLSTFGELIAAGKVRAIGASNLSAERLAEALRVSNAHNLPRYQTLQPHYNLCERERFEGALQRLCAQETLSVLPYYSLASGFLTGKYRRTEDTAGRPREAWVRKYLTARGLKILRALDDSALRLRSTLAMVALAWLRSMPSVLAPIASATSLEQLNELVAAGELQLDVEAKRDLDEASAFSLGP
jgi:aryl-alcohol dehydrogenase-like predicted oxidoreductase